MTAEIAVLNRHAVALAADSALTVGSGEKVFPSAEKIFALSDHCPVGAMVYGRADVMGVPWETVLKEYRAALGQRRFAHLDQYAEDLLAFLGSHADFFPESQQLSYIRNRIDVYFAALRTEIADRATELITKNGQVTEQEVSSVAEAVIDENHSVLADATPLAGLAEDFESTFRERYGSLIERTRAQAFEKLTLTPQAEERLADLAIMLFTTYLQPSQEMSGIVMAGFGDRDVFPAVWNSQIDGVGNNEAIRTPEAASQIDVENRAIVAPFAQREMVDIFMEGSDPGYLEVIKTTVAQLLTAFPNVLSRSVSSVEVDSKARAAIAEVVEGMVDELDRSLYRYRQETYVVPVINIVASLPKDELAAMAEALVNLTSFKQKVSAGLESVGGPIDVAVISKGDGLVWIRRKQYFRSDLNPHVMARYGRRESDATQARKRP